MTILSVFGGTGYTGGNIVKEAAKPKRSLKVLSVSRSQPKDTIPNVTPVIGNLPDVAESVVSKSDVIIAALSLRGDSREKALGYYQQLATLAAAGGKRLIVIGGFTLLRPAPDTLRFIEGALPSELQPFKDELFKNYDILLFLLNEAPKNLDWLFISPAEAYTTFNPGEALGHYRIGDDVALRDANGKSEISGTDFALAIVDEIMTPKHRGHIGIAY